MNKARKYLSYIESTKNDRSQIENESLTHANNKHCIFGLG